MFMQTFSKHFAHEVFTSSTTNKKMQHSSTVLYLDLSLYVVYFCDLEAEMQNIYFLILSNSFQFLGGSWNYN